MGTHFIKSGTGIQQRGWGPQMSEAAQLFYFSQVMYKPILSLLECPSFLIDNMGIVRCECPIYIRPHISTFNYLLRTLYLS